MNMLRSCIIVMSLALIGFSNIGCGDGTETDSPKSVTVKPGQKVLVSVDPDAIKELQKHREQKQNTIDSYAKDIAEIDRKLEAASRPPIVEMKPGTPAKGDIALAKPAGK